MQVISLLAISSLLFAITFLEQSARSTSTSLGACFFPSGEEAAALLELKTSLLRSNFKLPSSWVDADCCSWEGVECHSSNEISAATSSSAAFTTTNKTSSRMVIEGLLLSNLTGQEGQDMFYTTPTPWHDLNLDLFKAFRLLRRLDLSYNYIRGRLESLEISGMRKLQHLNLSHNYFYGTSPKAWASFSSLRYLDMSDNSLDRTFAAEGFVANLTKLEHLDLSGNYDLFEGGMIPTSWGVALSSLRFLDLSITGLSGPFPADFVVNLTKLEHLDLRSNYHVFEGGTIPTSWGTALPSLRFLNLFNTGLRGLFPEDMVANLSRLEHLDLGSNDLEGGIPQSWTSLKYLDYQGNKVNGSLSNQDMGLSKLEYLDLSYNNFEGGIPESLVALTSLKYLDLKANNFNGSLSSQDVIVGLDKLEYLDLSINNFARGWTIPSSWIALSSLRFLDLSRSEWHGSFPRVITSLRELVHLDLSQNSLSGPLPIQDITANLKKLEILDLSYNEFEGGIPKYWIDLTNLNLGHNKFNGSLPSRDTVAGLSKMKYLDLSYNEFEGGIPESWVTLTSLIDLNLGWNRLNSSLPHQGSLKLLRKLRHLILSNNQFEGGLPDSWTGLPSLILLDLRNNSLSGSMPCKDYGGLRRLAKLYLEINMTSANPTFLGTLKDLETLHFRTNSSLDLSYLFQVLNGHRSLTDLTLQFNGADSILPRTIGNLPNLRMIDVSGCQLRGRISETLFSNLTYLSHINLSGNLLEGSIPPKAFSNLEFLRTIDLRHNFLEGRVHKATFSNLISLRYLHLSYNKFTGIFPL